MRFPHGVTVTVQRSQRNRFGDRTYADHHTLVGCAIAPRAGDPQASTEEEGRRSAVIIGLSLYAPPGADIGPQDRVILPGGLAYQVVGQPFDYTNPFTGWRPGVEVALERVTG